jgi:predicted AlkP superfamily phosphohydrolase/phosphomutase
MRTLLDRIRKQWKKLPHSITERVRGPARWDRRMPDARIRANYRSFVVPTNANAAGIRLNLQGREPDGKIRPGKEEDEYVAGLIADLEALVETGDGRKVVREVIRSRDRFPGRSTELLPDLFIRWNRRQPIFGVKSSKVGTVTNPKLISNRSGDHRPGGLILLRRQGISAGTVIENVHDEDIAPTLAACLDVTLADVDGRSFI